MSILAVFIAGCQDTSDMNLVVTSNDSHSTIFAADSGNAKTHVYALTVTNGSLSNNNGSLYHITVALPAGFTLLQNTCQQVQINQTCQMEIQFKPTTSTDYFESGQLTFNAGITSKSLTIQALPATLTVAVANDPGDSHKTTAMVAVAGGAPVLAEIDTGSQLLVITEAAVGPDIKMTNQHITLDYGQGENILVGTLGYGSARFTTTTGQTLTTSNNTPIVVVPSIPQGDYQIILGMDLHTQAAARLYLPYPYDQMFVLNHTGHTLTFGKLTPDERAQFANYQLSALPMSECADSEVTTLLTPVCWNDQAIQVNYAITATGGISNIIYPTLFDSGASNASFQFPTPFSWMDLVVNTNGTTSVTNTIHPSLATSLGTVPLPLTSTVLYTVSDADKVNIGNKIFADFSVLYDQEDGQIGLQPL